MHLQLHMMIKTWLRLTLSMQKLLPIPLYPEYQSAKKFACLAIKSDQNRLGNLVFL